MLVCIVIILFSMLFVTIGQNISNYYAPATEQDNELYEVSDSLTSQPKAETQKPFTTSPPQTTCTTSPNVEPVSLMDMLFPSKEDALVTYVKERYRSSRVFPDSDER